MPTPSDDELAQQYSESIADGDFVTEFQEGSNRTRFMTPRDMIDLQTAREKARASETRRRRGIFRRVVD